MSHAPRQIAVSAALLCTVLSAVLSPHSASAAELRVNAVAAHRGLDDVSIQVDVVGVDAESEGPFSSTLTNRGSADFVLPAGAYDVMVAAEGFDAWSERVEVSFESQASATLYPAADVPLRGTVRDAQGSALAEALVSVSGARIAAPLSATSDAEGVFVFEALPAGYYDLRVTSSGGSPVTRRRVDVLGATEISVVVPDAMESPEVTRTQKFSCSAAGGPASGLWFAWLLYRRRR